MTRMLLARPKTVAILLIAVTLLAAWVAVAFGRVEGDVARAIKGTSPAFRALETLEAEFGAPSRDEVFLVRAGDFGDPATFRALEDLIIDFQLTEGVRAVLSVFALPDPAGAGVSFLSRGDLQGLYPAARLDALDAASPLAPYLMSRDRSAALIAVMPDLDIPAAAMADRLAETAAFADPRLELKPAGLGALQREISAALVADQFLIAPASIVLCVVLALLVFRCWRAAVLCALPSIAAMAGTFAAMALLGYALDPLMSIVPTLIIVLGIADSIHVFHAIHDQLRMQAAKPDLPAAIRRGLAQTMPAVVLAGATTALAFMSLLLVGSPTVRDIAVIGPVALFMTTLAVYLVLPVAVLLLYASVPRRRAPARFRAVSDAAVALMRHAPAVSILALVLLAGLLAAQRLSAPGYRLLDHVPRGSEMRGTLAELSGALPGSSQSFVLLAAADPAPGLSDADRDLLARAGEALYGSDAPIVPAGDLAEAEADHALVTRFLGSDGRLIALPLIGRLDMTGEEIRAFSDKAASSLRAEGIEDFTITGYSEMTSLELPAVVSELRIAFYIAVGLITALVAIYLRSLRVALIALVPNLVPILGVEAWLVLTGRPLTITAAIAFVVAFGIAVDDSIHLLNRIRLAAPRGARISRAMIEAALRATTAPIVTTSLVLLAGFATTAFSNLPSVSLFGQLTAAGVVLALLADLFLLPSLLCWAPGARPEKHRSARPRPQQSRPVKPRGFR